MPLLTRNPSHYLSDLQDESTEPLHVGLILGEGLGAHVEQRPESAAAMSADESSWVELAAAIHETTRSIRCLWLRADREVAAASSFCGLGRGLVGAVTVESLVLEGQGIGPDELAFLREYLVRNTTLRGIKFLRTRLDAPSSRLLNDFFAGNSNLRVLDLTANPLVDDKTVREILGAIMRNDDCRLETLNILENLDGDAVAEVLISDSGVDFIAFFVSQTPSLLTLRLRIRALNDGGLRELANIIKGGRCNIARLDISGKFGDDGIKSIAEGLIANESIRRIDVGMSEGLTDIGGLAILRVVQGQDESWRSKTTSNHTLQSVQITGKAGMSMSESVLAKLQSITNFDPLQTLQSKAWNYIDSNINDLSSINCGVKLGPHLLAFVSSRGGLESVFSLLRSRNNAPENFTNHPTPEKIRLSQKMEKASRENEILKALLKSERRHRSQRHLRASAIKSEDVNLRDLEEDEQRERKTIARCLLLPLFKMCETCKYLIELLKER